MRAVVRAGAVFALTLSLGPLVRPAQAQTATNQEDLGYARDVRWQVDGMPQIGAMEPTIRAVLERVHVRYTGVDDTPVAGFYPGLQYSYFHIPEWTPFYLYSRDTATTLTMA